MTLGPATCDAVIAAAEELQINLRRLAPDRLAVAFDETVTYQDLVDVVSCFARGRPFEILQEYMADGTGYTEEFRRTSEYLTHPIFHRASVRDRDAALHASRSRARISP